MYRTSAFCFGLFCNTSASDVITSTKPAIFFNLDALRFIQMHSNALAFPPSRWVNMRLT